MNYREQIEGKGVVSWVSNVLGDRDRVLVFFAPSPVNGIFWKPGWCLVTSGGTGEAYPVDLAGITRMEAHTELLLSHMLEEPIRTTWWVRPSSFRFSLFFKEQLTYRRRGDLQAALDQIRDMLMAEVHDVDVVVRGTKYHYAWRDGVNKIMTTFGEDKIDQ